MTCGIYKIENKINHHVYIGQSLNIEKRWLKHRAATDDVSIHAAFKKYGLDNFDFSIIEVCEPSLLDERERYWISYYDSFNHGYNETLGGQNAASAVKITAEQLDAITTILITTERKNQDIAQEFGVSENIISGINTGYYWKRDNIDYPIRKQFRRDTNRTCPDCGCLLKSFESTRCPTCAAKLRRAVDRPDKETLYQELLAGTFTSVGRKYGVADNSVRKWCASYGLPTHAKDYHQGKNAVEKKGHSLPSIGVQQIDKKTGEVIQTFNSLSEAERITGIAHITQASDPNNTTRKSAGGYIWKRIEFSS